MAPERLRRRSAGSPKAPKRQIAEGAEGAGSPKAPERRIVERQSV